MEQVRARRKERAETAGRPAGPTATLLQALLAEAHRSPVGEAYVEVAHGLHYRLAIEVTRRDPRAPQYTLVVLIDSPDRVGPNGRIPRGAFARIESALAARGYAASRLDNGWLAHERAVPPSRLAAEWRFVGGLLEAQGAAPEGRL